MNGILALGHFCESHGPCVVLCTQRCNKQPEQFPHSLTVPWCEACQSIDLNQALVSREHDNAWYVTTRTPLQQDLAFLLKQATVRSLSCEESSKDGGTMYFGDNERGHVLNHNFTVQDSLARGFYRKYCILLLMRDKIHLLNCWPILTKNMKKISLDIQEKASKVNIVEQSKRSQRAVRQSQTSPTTTTRSLSQLTGEPLITAHLHMWFTWLLSCETIIEKPFNVPSYPMEVNSPAERLKPIVQQMPDTVLNIVLYCTLTGIRIDTEIVDFKNIFKQLLPTKFKLPTSGEVCTVTNTDDGVGWSVVWSGSLPSKLPTLQTLIENVLRSDLPGLALEPQLMSLIMQWYNIACALSRAPTQSPQLLQALGVQKHDLPLLSYWTCQCRDK